MRPQPIGAPKLLLRSIMLPKYTLSEIFEASIYKSWGRKKMEQTLQWMMLNMENVTPGQHKKPIKIWQNLILSHLKIHLLIFSKSYIHFLVYNYRGEIGPETQSRTLTTLIFLSDLLQYNIHFITLIYFCQFFISSVSLKFWRRKSCVCLSRILMVSKHWSWKCQS